jgi:hypothetical protein
MPRHQLPPGPGRPKGCSNKTTAIVKEAFREAFQERGGKDALLKWAAKSDKNETEFYKLAARLIPTEITGLDGAPLLPPATDDDKGILERYIDQRIKERTEK